MFITIRKRSLSTVIYFVIGLALIAFFILLIYTYPTCNILHSSPASLSGGEIVHGQTIRATYIRSSSSNNLNAVPSGVSSGSQPKVLLSEKFYDFGTINTTTPVSHQIFLSNKGQADLLINNTFTTCGCTTADFSASKIPPGKTALITINFNPGSHNMSGTTVRRGVVFETNDSAQPLQEIWFQATVTGIPLSQSDRGNEP